MRSREISKVLCKTFQCKKLNKINICNILQHVLYNSLQYSNDLFDKFAKIITMWSRTWESQPNPSSKIFCYGFHTNLRLKTNSQEKKQALTISDMFAK